MGTRHLIVVKKDGENKIAQYGQWDGYLEGQGIDILRFLKEPENQEKLKKSLDRVRFLDVEGRDKEFVEDHNRRAPKYMDSPDERTEEQKRWFDNYITRDLGSKILENVANSEDEEIVLGNSIDFAYEGIGCEFAYFIDFDSAKFEVFEDGFGNLMGEFDLNNLPYEEEFLKMSSNLEDEDDEE